MVLRKKSSLARLKAEDGHSQTARRQEFAGLGGVPGLDVQRCRDDRQIPWRPPRPRSKGLVAPEGLQSWLSPTETASFQQLRGVCLWSSGLRGASSWLLLPTCVSAGATSATQVKWRDALAEWRGADPPIPPEPPLPSPADQRLRRFIGERMRMSHVYQPLMMLELLDRSSPAPRRTSPGRS